MRKGNKSQLTKAFLSNLFDKSNKKASISSQLALSLVNLFTNK